jgi:hypothetical protein
LLSGRQDDALPGGGRAGYLSVDTEYDGWVLPDGAWASRGWPCCSGPSRTWSSRARSTTRARFYDRFAQVVFLSASLDVLLERVRPRVTTVRKEC